MLVAAGNRPIRGDKTLTSSRSFLRVFAQDLERGDVVVFPLLQAMLQSGEKCTPAGVESCILQLTEERD